MTYISDDFKWDKLITISYPAGYGGDFMCNMIHMNYDTNHKFHADQHNRFRWEDNNAIQLESKISLKKINTFFAAYESDDIEKFWDGEYKWADNNVLKKCKGIFAMLYDEDPSVFKENYIQYIRNSLYEGYHQEKFIVNAHYMRPIKNFSIQEALPKSNNFLLYKVKNEYGFLFYLLAVLKEKFKKNDDAAYWIKFMCKDMKFDMKTSFDNMITIDVGKLFFENGYEEEAENIFSKTLNRNITLNRTILNEYKKNNIEVLGRFFKIKNANRLTPKELLETIIKPYPQSKEILECLTQ